VEQGSVGDASRQHAVDRKAVPGARSRRQRHPPALGLEPEQAAPTPRGCGSSPLRRSRAPRRRAPRRPPPRCRRWTLPAPRCRSHGLRVAPNVAVSVNGQMHSSGTFVLPTITAPAARRRRTTSASARAAPPCALVPNAVTLARHVDVVLDGERHAQQGAVTGRLATIGAAPTARGAARVGLIGLQQRSLGEHHAKGVQARLRAFDTAAGTARSARARTARRRRSARPGGRSRRKRSRMRPSACPIY